MSGGSWGYAYEKMDEFAWQLEEENKRESKRADARPDQLEARQALVKCIREVSRAMHAIEWVDSGDYAYPDDVEAIKGIRAYLARFTASVEGAAPPTRDED